MSTQLKNCKFSDKVLKEDANESVGNFKADSVKAQTLEVGSDSGGELFFWFKGHRFKIEVSYGEIKAAEADPE